MRPALVLALAMVTTCAAGQPGAQRDWGEPWEIADGRVQAAVAPPPLPGRSAPDRHRALLHTALNLLVEVYRRGTDDQDSGTCPYRPSCSEYALIAVQEFGPLQGGLMTADRLLRCNPWGVQRHPKGAGGFHMDDPVRGEVDQVEPRREPVKAAGTFARHLAEP